MSDDLVPGNLSAVDSLQVFEVAGLEAACFAVNSVYGRYSPELQTLFLGKVPETGDLLLKGQLEEPGRAVSLLGQNDFGHVLVFVCGRMIDLVSIDESDDIRILFDGTTFPQIRQLRPLVGPIFHLPV
jgi:hypothetical protein